MPSLTRRATMFAAAGLALGPGVALAGETILDVGGRIAGGGDRLFSLDDLEALPVGRFATTTPWHQGRVDFEGVSLDALLAAVGASGTRLRLAALNDYVVDAEVSDMVGRGAILAYRENGRTLPVSERGPLFLVFPFDSRPELLHQSVYARCVWQLASIAIL